MSIEWIILVAIIVYRLAVCIDADIARYKQEAERRGYEKAKREQEGYWR